MEIRQDQYDKEVILPIAIARGAGSMYLGGETLNFGDQWLISFRRAATGCWSSGTTSACGPRPARRRPTRSRSPTPTASSRPCR